MGATHFSFDKMLVVMGDGSWSDGIWTFDFETHQFEVVEWFPNPNFLLYDDFNNTYWAGFQFGGMMKSTDGLYWDSIPYFIGKSPYCMDFYGDHLVVSEVSNIYGIHYSDDGGETWSEATGQPMITDLDFDGWGNLCGIFPDYSNSSGLWSSQDFGETWDVMFWSDNMSAVGFDCFGDIFVGWEEDLGIARYDPGAPPPGLTFLNEGLSSLNINKVQINPTMSALAIFVCTDEGAFYSYDYMVGMDGPVLKTDSEIIISPNPAKDEVLIKSDQKIEVIIIHGISGKPVLQQLVGTKNTKLNVSDFPPGIYLVEIKTENAMVVHKLVVE